MRKSLDLSYIKFNCFLFVALRVAAATNLFGTPATDLTSNFGNTAPLQTYKKEKNIKY